MRLIEIQGSKEVLLGLRLVAGLDLERHSATQVDDDLWVVSGYATDQAVLEVEARGAAVTTVMNYQELTAHFAALLTQVQDEEAIG